MGIFQYHVIFQILMVCSCCLFCMIIVNQKANNLTRQMLFVSFFALMQNAGYLLELLSRDEAQALIATKFEYMGAAFITTSLLIFILKYRRVQLPKVILRLLFAWDALVVLLVWTYPAQHLYYTGLHFISDGAFPHLVIEPGIFYYIFMIIVLLQIFFGLYVSASGVRTDSDPSRRRNCLALFFTILIPIIIFTLKMTGVFNVFDPTPAGVTIGTTVFAIFSAKNHLFDVTEVAHENILRTMKEPVLILDNMFNFMEANDEAYRIFPELRDYHIGSSMDNFCLTPYFTEKKQLEYQSRDKAYYVNVTRIKDKWISVGHLITLVDVTEERMRQLANQAEKVKLMSLQAVQALANAIDAKDDYTKGHSSRVAEYSVLLAKKMHLDESAIENLRYAALLHDVGKIGIPDNILNKPTALTPLEYEIIQSHTVLGSKILQTITSIDGVKEIARHHHERYDGNGYPDKLKGTDIPYTARIVGIADAYDAMSSDRIYRKALPKTVIQKELVNGRGTQFDPELLDNFFQLLEDQELEAVHQTTWEEPFSYDQTPAPSVQSDADLKHFAEKLKSLENQSGALVTHFGEFNTFFEYLLNMHKRYGHNIHLAMITLKAPDNEKDYTRELERTLQYMEGAIRLSIRNVDVCCRYNENQIFVIFVDAGEENVQMIVERIFRNYYKNVGTTEVQPNYSVTQVE